MIICLLIIPLIGVLLILPLAASQSKATSVYQSCATLAQRDRESIVHVVEQPNSKPAYAINDSEVLKHSFSIIKGEK